jgi:hypothetical protein
LEYEGGKPVAPFKFNYVWLMEEDYRKLIEEMWEPLSSHSSSSFMHKFEENISRVKVIMKNWYFSFKEKSQALLKEIELIRIKKLFDDNSFESS